MKKFKFHSLCVVTTSLIGLLVSGSCTEPTTQLPGEVHAPTEHLTLTWLNEPIDFAYVSEDPFQTPSAWDVSEGETENGWGTAYNTTRALSLTSDGGAPLNPSGHIAQFRFDSGFVGGSAPAWATFGTNTQWRRAYFGTYFKFSNPWHGHVSNVNKLAYIWAADSNIAVIMYGEPGGPYAIRLVPQQFSVAPPDWLTSNVDSTPITMGAWHKLEVLVDFDAGSAKWWVDGQLSGNHSGIAFPAAGHFTGVNLTPVWGGAESITKNQTDYLWFDHVRFSGASSWPLKPPTFVTLTDYGLGDAIPSTGSIAGGWSTYNDSLLATRVIDATAPMSPSYVAQFRFPQGWSGGSPATVYHDLGTGATEFYTGMWWKPSSSWQGHPTSLNNIGVAITNHPVDKFWITMKETSTDTFRITTELQLESINNVQSLTGSTPVNIALGQWHRIEYYVRMSTTATSNDGIIRWSVDGVQVGNYTNVNFNPSYPFTYFGLYPYWGGVGGEKTQEDYFWFDHVNISLPPN